MYEFKAGATSQTIDVLILSSALTTGEGLTGLVYNTASLTCYSRKGATGTSTAVTLATQTVGGAYSSGGFVEVDATNQKGVYRFDIPNGLIDTVGRTTVTFRGAANMAPVSVVLNVVAFDPTDGVRLGLTALPNVAQGNAGALVTSGTGTAQIALSAGAVVAGTVSDKTGYSLTTAPLDAAGTRTALGLGSANLDTQLGTIVSSASSAASSSSSAATDASTAASQATAANSKAADLQTRVPATLVDGRMDSSIGAFPLVIDGTIDGAAALKSILSMARGNFTKTGDSYAFKDQSGTTIFTIAIAAGGRTVT